MPDDPNDENPAVGLGPGEFFRLAWVFYLALALAGVVWLGLAHGGLSLATFLDPDPRSLAVDVALGAGCAAALSAGWRLLRVFVGSMRRLEDVMRRWFGELDGAQVFVLALISGFSEELFFRGAMQSSLGWIWATLLFALLHHGPGRIFRVWTAFALVAGLAFAALTQYRGNILAATVAHFLVNWINLHLLMSQAPGASDTE